MKNASVFFCRNCCALLVASLPLYVSAQTIKIFDPGPSANLTFTDIANKLGDIANTIIPFLIGVAVVFVILGVFKYVSSAGDSEKLAEGKKVALYGLLALFLMFSFWGLVVVIKRSLFG